MAREPRVRTLSVLGFSLGGSRVRITPAERIGRLAGAWYSTGLGRESREKRDWSFLILVTLGNI